MITPQPIHLISSLPLKGALGGILMGLANLVPGVSGGTMLLAVGVYPEFIEAIAELTTFRFKARSIILLGSVFSFACTAILFFAGPTKEFVVSHQWMAYSLFIGLTLGGLPLVWRLARPARPDVIGGALFGLALMMTMSMVNPSSSVQTGPNYVLLFLAGATSASAMILPGISGSYLLILLGQYVPILSAVDKFKQGILSPSLNLDLIVPSLKIGIPVALGVIVGIVSISNLLKWLLNRHRKATLGTLLGLLLGALVGLWPFQERVPPQIGHTIEGVQVTTENKYSSDKANWPTQGFRPTNKQVLAAIGLIIGGISITVLIGRLSHH